MTFETDGSRKMHWKVGVVACAILFGFVCGMFYNRMPVSAKVKYGWYSCVDEGWYCGNINGIVNECCNGDQCTDRIDDWNWFCGPPAWHKHKSQLRNQKAPWFLHWMRAVKSGTTYDCVGRRPSHTPNSWLDCRVVGPFSRRETQVANRPWRGFWNSV